MCFAGLFGNLRTRAAWMLAALLVIGPDAGSSQGRSSESRNLAANPSFEVGDAGASPQSWNADAKVYTVDARIRRSGEKGLKYTNRDANQYLLCTQQVPLQAGAKYDFSVWVRTEELAGSDTGATIALECVDKNGKWLGGFYPAGVKGTRDWPRVRTVVRLSNEAATGHLTCYVRRGMTGTAWFDDVELRQVLDDPIRVEVLSPAYRGWIADAADPIRIRVQLNRADYEYDPQECRIEASLSDGNGRVLQKRSDVAFGSVALGGGIAPLGTAADIQFDPRPLGPGPCVVRTTLRDRGGAQRFTHESELTQATKGLQTAVRFDAHRRLIVDGKPFFPLGMYWAGIKEKDLAVYATSKFNCLMPYFWPSREQMDLAWRHRLRVIYSVKDFYVGTPACPSFIKSEADEEPNVRKYVREFRNHPALLAWYLNDELGEEYLPRLESHCRVEDGK